MLSALALLAAPALAGGVGLIGRGGMHGDRVYYYAENSIGESQQQDPIDQLNPDAGGGLELVLGDKDYKINAFLRVYYMGDSPVQAPPDAEKYTFNLRTEEWRSLGVVDAGIQFGVLGDAQAFQLCVIGILGSAIMTSDQTEFFRANAGVGFTYTFVRRMQAHAEAVGGIRYRKRLFPSAEVTAGLRYLFD